MSEVGQILIVEDNPDDYESTIRSFHKVGLMNSIQWCTNGQDALDYLRREGRYLDDPSVVTPAVVLLDLNMPGIDGRKVLQAIKEDQELKRLPVIVLTTSANDTDVNRCYDLGASTYIQKPVGFEKLVEAAGRLKGYWFGVAILPRQDASARL